MSATYRKFTEELIAKFNAEFAKGADVAAVARKFEVAEDFVNWHYRVFMLPAKERITGKTEKELATKIVKARADGLDFVAISMRTGLPYEQVRKIAFANGDAPRPYGTKTAAGAAVPAEPRLSPEPPARKPAGRKATRVSAAS